MNKIAISVAADFDFSLKAAIRGDVEPLGGGLAGFAIKNPTFPATITPEGHGPYLGRDAFGNWHRRDTVNQDERFTVSSNGYLVCAHRGSAPAFVDCPVQQWAE